MNRHIIRSSARTSAARRQIVERVEAFVDAHRGDTVLIGQLCHVVGVTERSLRNAFYDVRGMSPKQCVLRTRLGEVRRALRDARGNVTTIATDYGFYELGRFAAAYKAVYGESPSETLRGAGDMARV
jgi:transcriptional regulator GlxA family with amidase domain